MVPSEMGPVGIMVAVLGLTPLSQPEASPKAAGADQGEQGPARIVLRAVLDTSISRATRDYLVDALAQATAQRAEALVVELDTPGGLLDATRELVQAFLEAEVPIIVYVSPAGSMAGSAGTFIVMAAHVAAMAPGTTIGAAHPVALFGGDIEGDMADKVENITAAWARAVAETRGRNADWAEKAVRESAAIAATEALANNVVDLVAKDLDSLLAKAHGRKVTLASDERLLNLKGARIQDFAMSGRQTLVTFLANANLVYMLLLLGLFLLFLEFKNPGLIVPGVVGVLLLAFVLGVQVLPINWLGVLLIVSAVALFVAEVYVTSFGLLSVGGLTCLVIGSYLLFDVPGSTFRVDPRVVWSVTITFAALVLGVGFLLLRVKQQGPVSGIDAMGGELALVHERIEPEVPGKVRLRGAYWTAVADGTVEGALHPGNQVRVVRMEGTRAVVEPMTDEESNKG